MTLNANPVKIFPKTVLNVPKILIETLIFLIAPVKKGTMMILVNYNSVKNALNFVPIGKINIIFKISLLYMTIYYFI